MNRLDTNMYYDDDELLSGLPTYKEMLKKQAKLIKALNDKIKPLVEEIDISTQPALTKDEIESFNNSIYRRANRITPKYRIRTKVDIKPFNLGDVPGYTVSIVWLPGVTYGSEDGFWEVMSWSGKFTDMDWCYEGTEGWCTNKKVIKVIKRLIEDRGHDE